MKKDSAKKWRDHAETASQGGGQFESELKCVIKDSPKRGQSYTVVRTVGEPVACLRAWIKCPDDKTRPFVMQEDSILYQAIQHVMTYRLDNVGGSRKRVYEFEGSRAFGIVSGNGNKMDSWRPRWTYLLNVIPRQPTEIDGEIKNLAEANEHLCLLAQSPADIGIGPTCFKALLDVVENDGDSDYYDVVFTKTGSGTDTKYGCLKASRSNDAYGKWVKTSKELSAKERSWEPYDLAMIGAPTPAGRVVKNLGELIEVIDEDLGTSYLEELKKLAEAEDGSKQPARGKKRTSRKKPSKTEVKKSFPKGANLEPCEHCGESFPEDWTTCPFCGAEYNEE